jgi:hypothetical protein
MGTSKFWDTARYIDLFSPPVSLTYKGLTTYKTRIGTVVSLLYLIVLFSYGIY